MLSVNDFEVATAIAEKLHIPQEFGICLDEDYFDPDDLVDQVSALNVGEFRVDNGVSKAVIIFDNFNFVIKIPFNGGWYETYNEETDEYENSYFETFECADAPDNSDYCWDECIKVDRAYEAGFEKLFPQTSLLCIVGDQRFYIQEKVTPSNEMFGRIHPSEDSRNIAKSMDTKYWFCGETWRAQVIEMYGEDYFRSFVDWCDDSNNGILTDMHGGNYGYTIDGAPIILDCAGFRDN